MYLDTQDAQKSLVCVRCSGIVYAKSSDHFSCHIFPVGEVFITQIVHKPNACVNFFSRDFSWFFVSEFIEYRLLIQSLLLLLNMVTSATDSPHLSSSLHLHDLHVSVDETTILK